MSSRFKIEEVSRGGHGGHGGFLNRSMNRNPVLLWDKNFLRIRTRTKQPEFLAQVTEPQVLVLARRGQGSPAAHFGARGRI
jgi:hypothetical protein